MRLELHGAAEIIIGPVKNLQTSHDLTRVWQEQTAQSYRLIFSESWNRRPVIAIPYVC